MNEINENIEKSMDETEFLPENIQDLAEETEKYIEQQLEDFERQYRGDFEKNFQIQKKSLEALMRGHLPEITEEVRQIVFTVIDTGSKIPIYMSGFDASKDFNIPEFVNALDASMGSYLDGKEFYKIQQKMYYKLKSLGKEPSEIYPSIEPRYLTWDSKSKSNFRKRIARSYGRKMEKKG